MEHVVSFSIENIEEQKTMCRVSISRQKQNLPRRIILSKNFTIAKDQTVQLLSTKLFLIGKADYRTSSIFYPYDIDELVRTFNNIVSIDNDIINI